MAAAVLFCKNFLLLSTVLPLYSCCLARFTP
jgi:hypothetical protein